MTDYDVLVIGAGPAGSRAAFRLAKFGYGVGVLEKQAAVSERFCCTGIIGKECADLFEVDPDCILQGAKSAKVFAPSGEFLQISKDEDQAYILDRQAFDRSLADKAANAGATYHLGSQVTDIICTGNGVRVSVDQQGEMRNFRGRAVVIAAGFSSKLPQKLGLGQVKDRMFGAQVEVETDKVEEVEVHLSQKLAPGFFAWAVPIFSQGRARVGLFAHRHPGAYLREFIARLKVERGPCEAASPISHGGIPLKPLPRTYDDRVLVVGDAAGQVKPTTGGGIYYGLLCADMAADTLDLAFSANDFSGRRLSQYETLWKKKLGRELQIDYFARRLYNRLSDKQINEIFRIVRDNNIHQSMLDSSHMSFDWHGEMVLDGLKRLGPWRSLVAKYIPQYIWRSLRGQR